MVLPLLIMHNRASAASVQAFVALWATAIAAAAIGNYPTPLVGYGASAIIGYLLGLAPLAPRSMEDAASSARAVSEPQEEEGAQLRFA